MLKRKSCEKKPEKQGTTENTEIARGYCDNLHS